VIISHNMHHVFSVADRIMVLRRGKLAGRRFKDQTTHDEIVAMIVGSETVATDGSAKHGAGPVPPVSAE
jgi:ABC-type sugar transport system ATPase subunit